MSIKAKSTERADAGGFMALRQQRSRPLLSSQPFTPRHQVSAAGADGVIRSAEKVRSCLRRHGIRGATLDDLVQHVFLVAYLRKIEITDEWLCETARKLAANYRKLHRHEFEALDPGAVDAAIVEPMEPEARETVRRALEELDPTDAELLVRHVLGGESLAKIAPELGLTKSGAHLRLAAARRRFVKGVR